MRLSISRVYDLYRVPVSAWPTAAVRSPIGIDFQSFSFPSETRRWNCGSPLKTVLNGSRDSNAIAVAQIKNIGTRILKALIASQTEIEIVARSSLGHSVAERIYLRFAKFFGPFTADP